jgi:hypothetical protein
MCKTIVLPSVPKVQNTLLYWVILFSFQALILSQFKGYNACIDAFIEQVKFNLTVKSNILICIK